MIQNGPVTSILLATDLGASAPSDLRNASELALASGAKLHVVHVHEPAMISGESGEMLAVQTRVHEKRGMLLDLVAANAIPSAEVGNVRVEVGTAASVILAQGAEVNADVIVIGAHRRRGVADRFLGSTAEVILRHSTVPCLVLNGPLSLPVRRILVPSDFSTPARRALRSALTWASVLSRHGETEVTVAHVLDPTLELGRLPWAEKELEGDLLSAVEESSHGLEVTVPTTAEILRGSDPAEELIGHARAVEADLIVLGTHGDGVFLRALMGSVSSAMVRSSPIPVLLVPRTAGTVLEAVREAGPMHSVSTPLPA